MHTHTALSDVDWATGIPRWLCDVCSRVQFSLWIPHWRWDAAGRAKRTADPTTASVWVCPQGTLQRPGSSVWIHKSQSTAALITLVVLSSVCFFLNAQSSDAFRHICIRQRHIYSFVSNFFNNAFTLQRKIKEKTASVPFLSAFFVVAIFFRIDGSAYFMSSLCPAPVRDQRWDHINALTFSSSSFQLQELILCNGTFNHK